MEKPNIKPIPFINLKTQFEEHEEEIRSAIDSVLVSSRFIGGAEVLRLEEELAAFAGARFAVACGSGTDALLISLLALGVGPGDEVITTPFTFFATAAAAAVLGATPVFADICPDTLLIGADAIAERITEKTAAIIPVGLYGTPADMDEILSLSRIHEIPVIEDAAQSFGARYKNRISGNLGNISCVSFYPSKPLGAYGEAGALLTDNEKLAERLRMVMNQGQREIYKHEVIGLNGRLDALQAAILRVKLKYFQNELNVRTSIAARYSKQLSNCGIRLTKLPEDRSSSWAQFTIRTDHRDTFRESLKKEGIPTAVHYPLPLYRQPAFAHLDVDPKEYPATEDASAKVVSLPISPYLTQEEQDRVIDEVKRVSGTRI